MHLRRGLREAKKKYARVNQQPARNKHNNRAIICAFARDKAYNLVLVRSGRVIVRVIAIDRLSPSITNMVLVSTQ